MEAVGGGGGVGGWSGGRRCGVKAAVKNMLLSIKGKYMTTLILLRYRFVGLFWPTENGEQSERVRVCGLVWQVASRPAPSALS